MFSRLKNFYRALQKARREPPNWHIVRNAKPTPTHPLAGFWKKNARHGFGLAIGPADGTKYFVSFCGPGGCFNKGRYRPNTLIEGDSNYKIIDNDTIEVRGKFGFSRYVRCEWFDTADQGAFE